MVSNFSSPQKMLIRIFNKHYVLIAFIILFVLHFFFQFYKLDSYMGFGWDQTDNAWTAKHIIIDHQYPLVGMVAKADSGFNTGPLYYYYISIFYWLFGLNPLASPISAGVTSLIVFLTFFFLTKKLCSSKIALLVVFIETFSFFIILSDRSQWPVAFIPVISLIIFYTLYKIILGKERYLFLLAIELGLSMHVHFTSIFYFPIVFLTLPFFPRKKNTIIWGLVSILAFFCFLIPNLIYDVRNAHSQSSSIMAYLHTYYHGVHLRRFLQLTHDAFIEFDLLFMNLFINKATSALSFVFVPIFYVVYLYKKQGKDRFLFCYLIALWFLIPWLAFSTYRGELSNYYFFMTRPLVLIICAHLTYFLYAQKNNYLKIIVLCFWIYFAYANISEFLNYDNKDALSEQLRTAKIKVQTGDKIKTEQNIPEQYFLYYYSKNNKQ